MKKFKTKAYRITNRTNEVCDRKGSIKKGKEVILCGSQWTSQHIKHSAKTPRCPEPEILQV